MILSRRRSPRAAQSLWKSEDQRRIGRGLGVLLLALAAMLPIRAVAESSAAQPLYLDPEKPVEARVHDLISRLTLDEKAGLMKNASDGVARLGIPKYDWWNEALHGVARAGHATVFPQAIGLAATWNESLIRTVADTISTEARAKYNEAQRTGHGGERYRGLTFWTPNINIFRDPRWGRGQETYGEDPYLTSRIGVALVHGLQGDDPRHLKTAACAKHFVVHSGPDPLRYDFNVDPDPADLHETYLPAFEALVREARVEAVMTAYNSVYGTPCSMNPLLYQLLRSWKFDGHVVSDCAAIYLLYERYHVARDFPEAEALAVKAGLSLRCGDGEAQLGEAVRRGLLTEAQLDAGLAPILRTMFRLGFFDPAERVPFNKIPFSENDSPAHAKVALEAAQQAIVLLENDGVLPLDRAKLKRVAVIGPNADSVDALVGNYNGTPSAPVTVLAGLRAALGDGVRVDYARGCEYAEARHGVATVPRTALASCDCGPEADGDPSGLQGEFFSNPQLEGEPTAKQQNREIEFDWAGKPPAAGVPATGFSARWSGQLTAGISGEYELVVSGRGGVRMYLGGNRVIDAWASGEKSQTVTRRFAAGATTPIRIEYFSTEPGAALSLKWRAPPAEAGFAEAITAARAADAVIFVGGITAQLEGEDMRVDFDGFASGDRTRIELPAIQQKLINSLTAVGKPVVVVNLSGSAMAFESVGKSAGAIVQAWYPGEAGGAAVADVLLGKTNPAGRLPVTFYRSTADLPAFADYRMAGRTYRYFRGEPEFPFGHGLSYTRFKYANLRVTSEEAGRFTATVDVSNIGERDGDEVVQLYLQEPAERHARASKSLAGFRRIHLARGETRAVSLEIAPESLRRWDAAKNGTAIFAGEWHVLAGASSADIRVAAVLTVR